MKTQTKSKKVNKQWLHDHVNDTYVKLAQREGYRARPGRAVVRPRRKLAVAGRAALTG